MSDHTRYVDDLNETDPRVHEWVKDLSDQPWVKDLTEQQLLNEARIRVHYRVINRPVKDKKKKESPLSDSEEESLELIKLKIKLAKLKIKLAKAQAKAPKATPVERKEHNIPILDNLPKPKVFINFKTYRPKLSSKASSPATSDNEEKPVSVHTDNEDSYEQTDQSSSSEQSDQNSDSETLSDSTNNVQDICTIPDQINSVSTLRFIDAEFFSPRRPSYKVRCLSDSGCSLMLARQSILPPERWKRQPHSKAISTANRQIVYLHYMAVNVKFLVGRRIYTFDFWQFNDSPVEVFLGSPFWIFLRKQGITQKDNSCNTPDNYFVLHDRRIVQQPPPWVNEYTSEFSHAERGGSITQKDEINQISQNWKLEIEEILKDTFSDNP